MTVEVAQSKPSLLLGVPDDQLPRHVAVIMDGNGRWAQARRLPRVLGHREGVKSVRRVTEECCRLGLKQLTLYCFSIENWKRPKAEVDQLMRLFEQFLVGERPTLDKNDVRLTVIGRREGIPDSTLREMDNSIRHTADHAGLNLCLAVNYGGRAEIVDAVKRIASEAGRGELDPSTLDESSIESRLYAPGSTEPDLLIRTAGEMRISNFLLWQISYSEIWVTSTLWPDFAEEHLHQAIRDYARRERRYGGLNG